MIEITADLQKSYRYGMSWQSPDIAERILAIALRDMTAEVMRLEFEKEHVIGLADYERGERPCCRFCGYRMADPRHNYQWPDWQRAAHEKLIGETK